MFVRIIEPRENQQLSQSSPLNFKGKVGEGVTKVILSTPYQGEVYELGNAQINGTDWTFSYPPFTAGGQRTIVAEAFDASGELIDSDPVTIYLIPSNLAALVPVPPPDQINVGLTSATPSFMLGVFGIPGNLTEDCSPITNSRLRRLLVTDDVGPFRVTGLRPAVAALKRIFSKVKQEKPQVYAEVKTAGMLCCRKIRRGSSYSNHSWGTAIDLKFGNQLDKVGDGKTQVGLLELAPYFNAEKFYWGAEFGGSREDSMHFETSRELIQQWQGTGELD
jgi:hypothetical protein